MIATKVVKITVPRASLDKALGERRDPNRLPGNYAVIAPIGKIACEGREIIIPTEPELIRLFVSDLVGGHFAGVLSGRDTTAENTPLMPNPDLSGVLAVPDPQISYAALTRIEGLDDEQPDIELTTDLMMGRVGYNFDALVERADYRGFKFTGWGNPGVEAFLDIINGGVPSPFERERRARQITDLPG